MIVAANSTRQARGISAATRFATGLLAVRAAARVLDYAWGMRCVLGFDGGGTKTECVLMDESGRVFSRGRSGPSNPVRVGIEDAVASLQSAARYALETASSSTGEVAALVAGLAGTSRAEMAARMREEISRAFAGCAVQVCTDLELALAATGTSPAIVLVAGTGSAAIGRGASGRIERAGGYGSAIGDEGSAYDIGRKAVAAALRHQDRTGDDSVLGVRILRELGFAAWDALLERAQKSPDEVFPRVFPRVAEAAAEGDVTAQEILRDAAKNLAALVSTLIARLRLTETAFSLAKTGGMLDRSPFLDQTLDAFLRGAAPNATFAPLTTPPAEVAARLALALLAPQRGAAHRV